MAMGASTKFVSVFFMSGLCILCVVWMFYLSQTSVLSYQSIPQVLLEEEGHSSLSKRKDLPILFWSDVSPKDRVKLQASMTSHRLIGNHNRSRGFLARVKLGDDYRFCLKEAPFIGPFKYIPHSKSPCWVSTLKNLQCVPYFYLVGFSKSGTTDLYKRLKRHPEMCIGSKEKHWLDYRRYVNRQESGEAYASTFHFETSKIEQRIREEGRSEMVIGDGTPSYVFDSLYWPCYEGNRGLSEPKYTNADVIYRLNPHAKIIMLLRDPVSRLFSRYLTWTNKVNITAYKNASPQQFHSLATRAVRLYDACSRQWSHRHCAYNGTLFAQMEFRLQESLYSVYVRDWLNVFPRDQVLFIKFEDYVKNIPEYLGKTIRFLNMTTLSDSKMKRSVRLGTGNKGKHYEVGQILDTTKEMLQRFYAPFNQDLQQLLGDSRWAWGYE